jgi:glycerol-3-phosphate cytidylyltransferase-like family protein
MISNQKKIEMDLAKESIVEKMTTNDIKFNWKLERKQFTTTIFNKLKMTEKVDIRKVYGFIQNEMGITYSTPKGNTFPTELEHIKKFATLLSKSLELFQTSHILPKHKWGRVIPSLYLSLCVFHRPTRHSFADDNYIDIDMENAHPTIIYNICKKNEIEKPTLKKYIDNPKYYRALIKEHHNCDKDIAKQLPIIIMFGGTYSTWIKENNITENDGNKLAEIVLLESEIRDVIEIVYTNNPDIKKDVLKQNPNHWRNENEAKRGVMGLWCQTLERHIQEQTILYLVLTKKFKIEEVIPSQDGFMILKERFYEDIIPDVNRNCIENIGIPIKFVIKPFDEKYEIPLVEGELSFDEWIDNISVKKLADYFLDEKMFKNYIIRYNDNLYIYYGEMENGIIKNGRWYDETNEKRRHKITRYISENLYETISHSIKSQITLKKDDREYILKTLRDHTSRSTYIKDILTHIISKAKIAEEDFNSDPFLLGFLNGVYDLRTAEFREYQYDDYITLTTRYDYKPVDYEDKETIKMATILAEIIQTIQPDEEHRDLLLLSLASGLDGRAYQKIFMYNGQGGNGKGLIGSLMDIVLGDYYHQPGNGILKDIEKANTPSPDMINLKNKRYINFKEVSGKIKAAMLRNLTGGGKFSGRYLNQNPEQFYMSGTFVMEFNTDPELDGEPQRADYRRMVNLFFPTNFTDDETKIGKQYGNITFQKANTYYETNEFLEKSKYLFLDLLLNVYKDNRDKESDKGLIISIPKSIRDRTEKFLENQNIFHKLFNRNWVMTSSTEKIKVKVVWDSIKESGDYKELSYEQKKTYGRDAFYKYIEGIFPISGNTKTGKLICGVERKEEHNDIDNDDDLDDEDEIDDEHM